MEVLPPAPPPVPVVQRKALTIRESVSIPARKKRHRCKATADDVDAAMTMFKGMKTKAAEHLGMSLAALNARLRDNAFLSLRWSQLAAQTKARIENTEASTDQVNVLEKMIQDQNTTLDLNGQRILKQLKQLERRIEWGERAIEFPDNIEFQKFAFRVNEKGDPSEERMLREQYIGLLEEFRSTMKTCTDQVYIKSKIMKEMSARKLDRPNANRPGFRPKGQSPTRIMAQHVTINEIARTP